jgi:hypothetical protein
MTKGHLATRFRIHSVFPKNAPDPSTEAWDLALFSGHLQPHATIPFPLYLTATTILNSILASFLTWYFITACVGC